MIGITFALRSESSDLLRSLPSPRRDGELIFTKIRSRQLVIAHTGVGAKHCHERLEILIHKARPRFLISAGFAGAVTEELHAGDLVFGANLSNADLLGRARHVLAADARSIRLFTSESIIDSTSRRNEIARRSGASAVDMETAAIANVCNIHDVPLLSLRAISDSPTEPFPAPMSILFDMDRQRTNYGRLLAYILREPAAIGRLARFNQRIKQARATLTRAIVALVHTL